jgi:hypothetical protein
MFVLRGGDWYIDENLDLWKLGEGGHFAYDLQNVKVFASEEAAREILREVPAEGSDAEEDAAPWVVEPYVDFETFVLAEYLKRDNSERASLAIEWMCDQEKQAPMP